MTTHKHINVICCVVLTVTVLLTCLLMGFAGSVSEASGRTMGYENKLFDSSVVHTIDIKMADWDDFLAHCKSEEYYICDLVIDGESYPNVAIRGKGNTSLTQVDSFENDRYSFKVEFDHYDNALTYHGLDKLCLNNIIQDNTYMKDYLTYQMMGEMGVAAPLCSYAYITVNGEDWGLYLAVEAVEESFLQRNYGNNYGDLYKPDSMDMGGGRGNGKGFRMEEFEWDDEVPEFSGGGFGEMPDFGGMPHQPGGNPIPDGAGDWRSETPGFERDWSQEMPGRDDNQPSDDNGKDNKFGDFGGGNFGGGFGGMGSSDVLLQYTDDDFDSYSNIFDNAKTPVTNADKKRLITALQNLSEGNHIPETVDVDAVIRYFVVHNFVVNFDSYTGSMVHNYYLYEKDGQLQMIPWDYNLAFGTFQSASGATSLVNYPIDSPVSGGNAEERPMIAWIFAEEEYTEAYHKVFAEFIQTYFTDDEMAKLIDDTAALIAPYVQKDPTAFCTYEEFETGVAALRKFCRLRGESIQAQLVGTISSTSQTQNPTNLIDADHLNLLDMGGMEGKGFGGDHNQGSPGDMGGGFGRGNQGSNLPPPMD